MLLCFVVRKAFILPKKWWVIREAVTRRDAFKLRGQGRLEFPFLSQMSHCLMCFLAHDCCLWLVGREQRWEHQEMLWVWFQLCKSAWVVSSDLLYDYAGTDCASATFQLDLSIHQKCFLLLDNYQLLVTFFAPCLIVQGMPRFIDLLCYKNGNEIHGPLDVHLYI